MITESNEINVACRPVANTHFGSNDTTVGAAVEESTNKVTQGACTVGVDAVNGDGVT